RVNFFHKARHLISRGSGPYFFLPKLESSQHARRRSQIFVHAQNSPGIEQGAMRATAHIESTTAVSQLEEIGLELRAPWAALEAAGWDYLFSVVKNLRNTTDYVLPDRERLTMDLPLMKAFTDRLVATCHRRGAHATGTMSNLMADHPDEAFVAAEFARMREDK